MNTNKENNLKEKLKQALASTERVISDDFINKEKKENNKDSKEFNFNLENISSKKDFIKARAVSDSSALKKKFSNNEIYRQNLPTNSSCKSLYAIAERIRYECLGSRMLKGIQKNLKENYNQLIETKKKDQLKTKDDVPIAEAFELYMLKKFHGIKLNSLSNGILNFWENDFDQAIDQHIEFLKKNLESQKKLFLKIF